MSARDGFDRATASFADATSAMRALGRALADLGVALAPLVSPRRCAMCPATQVASDIDGQRCPFCRCSGMLVLWQATAEQLSIGCEQCGAMGPVGVSAGEALRLWNGTGGRPQVERAGGSSEPGGER